MLHTKSGISFDFICEDRGGARDYILKDLLEGVSIEDLIRGEVFIETYTYLNKEGQICRVEIESLHTDELIDSRNDFYGGFMDELSTIHVSEEGLAKVRAEASASEVLSEEEIEEINDLVQESLTLSYYYSGEKSLYEFEDADFEMRTTSSLTVRRLKVSLNCSIQNNFTDFSD